MTVAVRIVPKSICVGLQVALCLAWAASAAKAGGNAIQECPLERFDRPVAVSSTICPAGHCVFVNGRMICKCIGDDDGTTLLVSDGSSNVIKQWEVDANFRQTNDFEVLIGKINNNEKPILIVANRDRSSNGILVDYWTLYARDAETFELIESWSTEDYGEASFARARLKRGSCDILVTEWRYGKDIRSRSGLYFVGSWFALTRSGLEPLQRKRRIRRYLFSFERERASDRSSATGHFRSAPGRWLREGKLISSHGVVLEDALGHDENE